MKPAVYGFDDARSVYDDLSPTHAYLADQFAGSAKRKGNTDVILGDAMKGITLEEQDQLGEQQRKSQAAMAEAQRIAALPDEEYKAIKGQIQQEMQSRPAMPQMGNPQLSNGGLIAGALGSLMDPQNAAQIASAPYRYGEQRAREDFQIAGMGYENDMRARQERIGYLGSLLDDARTDRQTKIQAAMELAKLEQDQYQYQDKRAEGTRQFNVETDLKNRTLDQNFAMGNRKLDASAQKLRVDTLKGILREVAPANRPAIIGQMGLGLDDAAIQAMSELTEAEKLTGERTEGQKLKNQFDSRTMEEKINQFEMKGDILELEKAGKSLSNEIATIRKENLPAEFNARINNLNARAAKANSGGTSPQGRPMAVGTAAKLIEKYHANNDLSNAYNEEYGMLADLLRNASMSKNEKEVNRIRNAMNGVRAKMIVAASNANAARIAADRSGINVDGDEQITAVNPGPTGNIGGGPQVKVTSKKQNPASSRGKTYKTKTGGKFEF